MIPATAIITPVINKPAFPNDVSVVDNVSEDEKEAFIAI